MSSRSTTTGGNLHGAFLVMRWLRGGGDLSSRLLDRPARTRRAARSGRAGRCSAPNRSRGWCDPPRREVEQRPVRRGRQRLLRRFRNHVSVEVTVMRSPRRCRPAHHVQCVAEQLRREDLDARSDLYQFGIVVFEGQPAGCPSSFRAKPNSWRSARGPGAGTERRC